MPKARPVKPLSASAVVPPSFRDLLDPALYEADAEAALETFDRQHFQVRQNPVLKMSGGIFCVEFHLPGAAQFNIRLRNNLCVVQPPVCLRINPVGPAPHFSLPNKGSVALE